MEADRNDNRTDLSAVHGVLLEMLKTLAAFCEANGVRYFLYCGTLLGAIRHKGFIPWDDDVDIVMPFKDYKRFLKPSRRSRVSRKPAGLTPPHKFKQQAFCGMPAVFCYQH